MREGELSAWEDKKRVLLREQDEMQESLQKVQENIWKTKDSAERMKNMKKNLKNFSMRNNQLVMNPSGTSAQGRGHHWKMQELMHITSWLKRGQHI